MLEVLDSEEPPPRFFLKLFSDIQFFVSFSCISLEYLYLSPFGKGGDKKDDI